MTNEKLRDVAIVLLFLLVVLAVNNFVLTEKITTRVMNTLKRDYVPGPYEPGFDPDKVPPKSARF
jgi:NADH:ubiquinone oxidoreductase subunit 3 (subunit A)